MNPELRASGFKGLGVDGFARRRVFGGSRSQFCIKCSKEVTKCRELCKRFWSLCCCPFWFSDMGVTDTAAVIDTSWCDLVKIGIEKKPATLASCPHRGALHEVIMAYDTPGRPQLVPAYHILPTEGGSLAHERMPSTRDNEMQTRLKAQTPA